MSNQPADPAPPGAQIELAEVARLLAARQLPPVELWNPPHCGASDMRISRDGTWYHGGTPIGRPARVKLFSTILRREADGSFVLVTPVEKLDIDVEDAPFVAVEMTSDGAGATRRFGFRLNTDEFVIAGPDHPVRVETAADGTPRPYVRVRAGLDALINRPVFYEMVGLALDEGTSPPGLWSAGCFFAFAPGPE
ncbi:MAG: DUF1285 domain-containing protein [Polymorphobacter sp.]